MNDSEPVHSVHKTIMALENTQECPEEIPLDIFQFLASPWQFFAQGCLILSIKGKPLSFLDIHSLAVLFAPAL